MTVHPTIGKFYMEHYNSICWDNSKAQHIGFDQKWTAHKNSYILLEWMRMNETLNEWDFIEHSPEELLCDQCIISKTYKSKLMYKKDNN